MFDENTGLVTMSEPQANSLGTYVGRPVIIEPIARAERKAGWTTTPWRALVWIEKNGRYEAEEQLIFAKAIVDALEVASTRNGWLGGVVAKTGSQLWIDSSLPIIMNALMDAWKNISSPKVS